MAKLKNISGKDLTIPGIGIIKSGETVEMPDTFRNANFIRVKIIDKKEVDNIKTKKIKQENE